MRALLFANHRTLDRMDWTRAASDAGLEPAAFDECLQTADIAAIHAEKEEADRLGVASTPTFFIGIRTEGGAVRLTARSRGAPAYPAFKDRLEQTIAAAGGSTLARID